MRGAGYAAGVPLLHPVIHELDGDPAPVHPLPLEPGPVARRHAGGGGIETARGDHRGALAEEPVLGEGLDPEHGGPPGDGREERRGDRGADVQAVPHARRGDYPPAGAREVAAEGLAPAHPPREPRRVEELDHRLGDLRGPGCVIGHRETEVGRRELERGGIAPRPPHGRGVPGDVHLLGGREDGEPVHGEVLEDLDPRALEPVDGLREDGPAELDEEKVRRAGIGKAAPERRGDPGQGLERIGGCGIELERPARVPRMQGQRSLHDKEPQEWKKRANSGQSATQTEGRKRAGNGKTIF